MSCRNTLKDIIKNKCICKKLKVILIDDYGWKLFKKW